MLVITSTVDEYEIARGILDRNLALLALAAELEGSEIHLTSHRHLREEIAQCVSVDPIRGLMFLKRWTAAMEAFLRDDPEYADQLPPLDQGA